MIYVIGSLKVDRASKVATELRDNGYEVFDDWQACHPNSDQWLTEYEQHSRKRGLRDALNGKAMTNQFQFDYNNLLQSEACVLVLPCGRSAHLELGWMLGRSRPGFILLDGEPTEYDLMYKLATGIAYNIEELLALLNTFGVKKERG